MARAWGYLLPGGHGASGKSTSIAATVLQHAYMRTACHADKLDPLLLCMPAAWHQDTNLDLQEKLISQEAATAQAQAELSQLRATEAAWMHPPEVVNAMVQVSSRLRESMASWGVCVVMRADGGPGWALR